MREIYIDELETVWHRTKYSIPDDLTDENLIEFFEEGHHGYELEEINGVDYLDSEYLYETGQYSGEYEVYDYKDDNLIYKNHD